jgi:hypothetical protein
MKRAATWTALGHPHFPSSAYPPGFSLGLYLETHKTGSRCALQLFVLQLFSSGRRLSRDRHFAEQATRRRR